MKLSKDIEGLFNVLHSLREPNGFYRASISKEYKYTWLRDNFYCSMPELWNDPEAYAQTYYTWLDYYISVEKKFGKFSSIIKKGRIDHTYEFPNVKINLDLTEMSTGWNHFQLDTIGYFLFGISAGLDRGISMIRNDEDIAIINKSIMMMDAIKYHKFKECGAWEENNEVRMSTIGIVVAGLKAIDKYFTVPKSMIEDGMNVLKSLGTRETKTRYCDLAQLFLLYPFNVLDAGQSCLVLYNVEANLLRERGVIRYSNDIYHRTSEGEAEWVFGMAYLGIIYANNGDYNKAESMYKNIMEHAQGFNIPELYYAGTNKTNDNNPLGWSIAMTIQLARILNV